MAPLTTVLAEPLDFEDAPVRRCATPGCGYLGGCGVTRRFCPDCAARLARVREWLLDFYERRYRIFGTEDPSEEWDDG